MFSVGTLVAPVVFACRIVFVVFLVSCASADKGASSTDAAVGADAACTPVCEARTCGDDGCGGSCAPGCTADEDCTPAGQCESACVGSWNVPLSGVTAGRLISLPGGDLYVAGAKDDSGLVVAVDRCRGVERERVVVAPSSATSSTLFGIASYMGDVYAVGNSVVGDDPGDAMYARVNSTLESVQFAVPLFGSAGIDESWDLAITASGSVWMAGTSDVGATPRPWAIKGDRDGKACGFGAIAGTGVARAIAAVSDTVYIGVVADGEASLLRFADASCAVEVPCGCTADWSVALSVGVDSTEARAITLIAGDAYVAGFANDVAAPNHDYYGFVVRISLSTGQVLGTYKWNPTSQWDVLIAMATDGDQVFVGGMQGWDGTDDGFSSGTASLHALPHPFVDNAPTAWIDSIADLSLVSGIAADSEGLFVAGRSGTTGETGSVRMCDKRTGCP